jgi:hypothetical protein
VVDAILFLARTGLPVATPPIFLPAVGSRLAAVAALAQERRLGEGDDADRHPHPHATRATAKPTMVMIDAQTVRGGRAGPTFHEAGGRGGRTNGTKRSIVIEILGLPLAVQVDSAKPHDVHSGRELLARMLPELGTVRAIAADRGHKGLNKMAAKKGVKLEIKAPPKRTVGFMPLAPLCRVEHAFARLGRSRVARSRRARLPVGASPGGTSVTRLFSRR